MSDFLQFWYQALAADHGLAVATTDRNAMRQKLYSARAAANDPDLDKLSLVLSPTDDAHIWIIKKP